MPRKNPVAQRERDICARLRDFRQESKLSQVAFARLASMDSGRLGNYEHALAILNYPAARAILSRFPINPRWLATGNGPMILSVPIDLPELRVGERTPFSRVYDEQLVARFSPILAVDEWDEYNKPQRVHEDARGRVQANFLLCSAVERWLLDVPDGMISEFLRELYAQGEKMLKLLPEPDEATRLRRRKEVAEANAALGHWSTWRSSSSKTKPKTKNQKREEK